MEEMEREREGREREQGEMEGKRDGECSACLCGPELGTLLKVLLRLSAMACIEAANWLSSVRVWHADRRLLPRTELFSD